MDTRERTNPSESLAQIRLDDLIKRCEAAPIGQPEFLAEIERRLVQLETGDLLRLVSRTSWLDSILDKAVSARIDTLNDFELSRFAATGLKSAKEKVAGVVSSVVKPYFRRHLNNTHDAMEAQQIVQLRILEKIGTYNATAVLTTWIGGFARRVRLEFYNKRKTRSEIGETIDHQEKNPLLRLITSDAAERVHAAIAAALKDGHFKIDTVRAFRLRLDGHSYKVIADRLGGTEHRQHERVRRMKLWLREFLANDFPNGLDLE